MRLFWDHRSKACNTCPSATDRFVGSVFVLICCHRSRIVRSRSRTCPPWVIDFLKVAMRTVRSFHVCVSGDMTNLSIASKTTAVMAKTAKISWRLLILIPPSFRPLKVKTKLDGTLASDLIGFHIGCFLGGPQLIDNTIKRLVIPGHARAGHG